MATADRKGPVAMLSAARRPAALVAAALSASVLLGAAIPAFAEAAPSTVVVSAPAPTSAPLALADQQITLAQTAETTLASPAATSSPTPAPAPKNSGPSRWIALGALLLAGVGAGLFLSWTRARRGIPRR